MQKNKTPKKKREYLRELMRKKQGYLRGQRKEQFLAIFNYLDLDKIMAKAKKLLTDRELYIIKAYYGINRKNPLNLETIGEKWGISKQRAGKIKDEAIAVLINSLSVDKCDN